MLARLEIFEQTLGQNTVEQRAGVEGGAEVEGPRGAEVRGRGAGRRWASRSGNENKTRVELRENE